MKKTWGAYWAALGISAACTALAAVMYPYFELTNLVMVYLLGATISALRLGRGPASVAAVANILEFDFFFVPPRFSFEVADIQYVVTFGVMLAVALIIASLGARVTAQAQAAAAREHRIALEQARLKAEAELSRVAAETEGLRNTLLASISHDLRTPLAVIRGASSALSDPSMTFDAEARRSLSAQIEGKSKEMGEIISNVLDLMRLESGGFRLRLDWVTIEDLMNSALQRLSSPLSENLIEVCVPTNLPPAHVDGSLVLQVFANLLENVGKHTPAGTRVSISAALEDAFLRVNFDDTGPGLPPGDPERLFAKFHRGRDEGSTGGAGLGLSICRAILTAHGGLIDARPRPGGGARFSFTLPVA